VSLEQLLEQADVVSVHCPLNETTCKLLDEKKLRLMKASAFLINTARGSIVDEMALEAMLAEQKLAGAAMDVLASEPGASTHPLFKHDNFMVTPHMAWYSEESARDLKRKAAEEVRRVLCGEAPLYQVNKFEKASI
jgi:D-3-phosphoglycerate dehydrogenase